MTAQELAATAWVIPAEGRTTDPVRLNSTLGNDYNTFDPIRTLSTNGARPGDQTGLLFTPNLLPGDACIDESSPYVPENVTRVDDLPPNLRVLGLAPWTSSDCALKYMEAARTGATHALLFFIPGIVGPPPEANDPRWTISSSRSWKGDNGFPTYALSSADGARLMEQSADYSGNLTSAPNGNVLADMYPTDDYVRLYASVNTGSGNTLPSLWVFLLVVLGILLVIIGLTSLSMHLIQRRRRNSLRRRVANGEVDLEALGIKRLTVPQEVLEKMPLYVYGTMGRTAGSDADSLAKEEPVVVENTSRKSRKSRSPPKAVETTGYHPTALSQPTCPICLEDFEVASAESEGTTVRELPCHHIFHPECVDVFLRDNSSLCPMCKETALPKGYCPSLITNAMVRRERMVRTMQRRAAQDPESMEMPNLDGHTSAPSALARVRMRTRGIMRGVNRDSAAVPVTSSPQTNAAAPVIPTSQTTPVASAPASTPSGIPPAAARSTTSRQEWARQRALSMVGRDQAPIDPDAEEAQRTPGWKRAFRTVFGGR
ncbi:unnamed protein product [Zymoseptoria tritici ST99CH_3D7]|uniref:RING-type domain-containing protein n=2 Tax=Zymoseptoria tritici TaxID=1047171 RepID=A0A1X7RDM6_ZYMT9|nr:unnamed protein product [Zymoseptoria tritici ST99CH_3D7]SMR41849.1 unnamed protein product [Zymoseptoria tritici ST99CH_1E4]